MSGTEQVEHFNMLKGRMATFVGKYVNPGAAERDHLALPIQREIMVESARVGLLSASFPKV